MECSIHLSPHENILTIALINIYYLYTIALLGNRTFYSTSRDQNQPIKRYEFNKVLYNIEYLDKD